jgi:hypothetical protein
MFGKDGAKFLGVGHDLWEQRDQLRWLKTKEFSQLRTPVKRLEIHQEGAGGVSYICEVRAPVNATGIMLKAMNCASMMMSFGVSGKATSRHRRHLPIKGRYQRYQPKGSWIPWLS